MEAALVAVFLALPLPLVVPGGMPAATPWMAMVAWPLPALLAGPKKHVEVLASLPLDPPQLG